MKNAIEETWLFRANRADAAVPKRTSKDDQKTYSIAGYLIAGYPTNPGLY